MKVGQKNDRKHNTRKYIIMLLFIYVIYVCGNIRTKIITNPYFKTSANKINKNVL